MAKWKVTFVAGTDKEDETYDYEVTVTCHWSYNAAKLAYKELDSDAQLNLCRKTLSISVVPAD